MHEIEIEAPRYAFARKHAEKALCACTACCPDGHPADIVRAIQFVLPGFQVIPLDQMPNAISAVTLKDDKMIGYNRHHAPVRVRFSIAHEVGHILLEHPASLLGFDARERKPYEREADAFAGEFLVPRACLEKAFGRCRDVAELAKTFNVSRDVMFIRFTATGLINRI